MANKENMRKWVAALRSGDYQQGKGSLYKELEDTYCCLGVACEVAKENGVEVGKYLPSDGGLPRLVAKWLGTAEDGKTVYVNGISVIKMNDRMDWNFKDIADAIEEFFELCE